MYYVFFFEAFVYLLFGFIFIYVYTNYVIIFFFFSLFNCIGFADIDTVTAAYTAFGIDHRCIAATTVIHHFQNLSPASLHTLSASTTLISKDL